MKKKPVKKTENITVRYKANVTAFSKEVKECIRLATMLKKRMDKLGIKVTVK